MKPQLQPLTTEEQNILLPKLIKLLKKTSKTKTIYAPEIVMGFNDKMESWGCTGLFSESRLRKLISHIRTNGLLPIMSGPYGYYVSTDKQEIIEMANSLEQRAKSIYAGAKGLRDYAQEIENEEKQGWDFKFDKKYDSFFDEIEKTSDPNKLFN